jgi:uncharacterized protein YkwD
MTIILKPFVYASIVFGLSGCGSNLTNSPIRSEQPMVDPTVNMDDLQEEDKLALKRHNYYRSLIPELKDNNLTWDIGLAEHAQAHVNYLAQNIPKPSINTNPHAKDLKELKEGENISWSSIKTKYAKNSPLDLSKENKKVFEAVDAWAAEAYFYDYDTNKARNNEVIGHYTQLIWKNTTKVGCAKKAYDGGEWTVCRYAAPGNHINKRPY